MAHRLHHEPAYLFHFVPTLSITQTKPKNGNEIKSIRQKGCLYKWFVRIIEFEYTCWCAWAAEYIECAVRLGR